MACLYSELLHGTQWQLALQMFGGSPQVLGAAVLPSPRASSDTLVFHWSTGGACLKFGPVPVDCFDRSQGCSAVAHCVARPHAASRAYMFALDLVRFR